MKFCFATGSRADFGYLKGVIRGLNLRPDTQTRIIATGTHLSLDHGETYKEIQGEGFQIAHKIKLDLSDDSPHGVSRAMADATAGFSGLFASEKPDWLVVIGDRYEIFSAVQAALIHKIPTAHLGGGDVTEGAIDDSIRHAISKMSHLHFVSNEIASRRLISMGENPANVHVTGSTTIDSLLEAKKVDRADFFNEIQFNPKEKNFIVTFHPETLSENPPEKQMKALLDALTTFLPKVNILFTRPNADSGNREISRLIDQFVEKHPETKVVASLGQNRYANALRHFDVIIGNSSSAIYETPTFLKPSVNIGDRQKGRVLASSVVQTIAEKDEISKAIAYSLTLDCSQVKNPYGDGHASERIVDLLLKIRDPKKLLRKSFFMKSTQI